MFFLNFLILDLDQTWEALIFDIIKTSYYICFYSICYVDTILRMLWSESYCLECCFKFFMHKNAFMFYESNSYFYAYNWSGLKHISISQTWFSIDMSLYKTIMLVKKTFLCMHFDESHYNALNILMQTQYIW